MIRTFFVIMAPILIITFLFTRTGKEYPVQPVDWRAVVGVAREEAKFPVLAPEGLPEGGDRGWVSSKAKWLKKGEPGVNGEPVAYDTWQNGWLSPEKLYFGITQSDGPAELVIADVAKDARPDAGESKVAGRSWQRYKSPNGRTFYLVERTEQSTNVIEADTDYSRIEQFATTLKA